MTAIEAGNHEGVVAEVAVMGLVVVYGAGVLAPELDLVALDVCSHQEPLGGVDEVGIDGDPIQRPGGVGKKAQARELDAAIAGDLGRLGAGDESLGPGVDL